MYPITTTPGFIITSHPYGEADKILSIFTRDLGLVEATARGIRLEQSKLRYSAQLYSFGTFSFVRGKEFWRLTSIRCEDAIQKCDANTQIMRMTRIMPVLRDSEFTRSEGGRMMRIKQQELVARIALLLRRLLHGEEAHTELFDCIENCVKFLGESSEISDEQMKILESITVFRMMHALGYIGDDRLIDNDLRSADFSISLLNGAVGKRALMNQHINKALRESHL